MELHAANAVGQRVADGIFSRGASPAAVTAPQQQKQKSKQHQGQPLAQGQVSAVAAAIDAAVKRCMEAGQLAGGQYTWPGPSAPTAKQAKVLPANIRWMSAQREQRAKMSVMKT